MGPERVTKGMSGTVSGVSGDRQGSAGVQGCGNLLERPDDLPTMRAALLRALGDDRVRFVEAGRALAEARPWSRHVDEVEATLRRWAA